VVLRLSRKARRRTREYAQL